MTSLTVTRHLVALVRAVEIAVALQARRQAVGACAVALVGQVGTLGHSVTADGAEVRLAVAGDRARLETGGSWGGGGIEWQQFGSMSGGDCTSMTAKQFRSMTAVTNKKL